MNQRVTQVVIEVEEQHAPSTSGRQPVPLGDRSARRQLFEGVDPPPNIGDVCAWLDSARVPFVP
jgi:hypothetical protein